MAAVLPSSYDTEKHSTTLTCSSWSKFLPYDSLLPHFLCDEKKKGNMKKGETNYYIQVDLG